MDTFSDEFIKEEIGRLEEKYAKLRVEYDAAVKAQIDATPSGEMRHYFLPSDHPVTIEMSRVKDYLGRWNREKTHREQTRLIKKVTTFPEEIQIGQRDLVYMALCDSLADFTRALQKDGLTKAAILKDIKNAISQPEANWTDELVAEFLKS